jgi:hypothetical protein
LVTMRNGYLYLVARVGDIRSKTKGTPLFGGFLIDMYRIDKLVTASTCSSAGTTSIDCQIHLVADVGNIEICTTTRGGERG